MARLTLLGRLRRRGDRPTEPVDADDEFVEIDAAALTGVFAAPSWLRDLGIASWLLVGVAAFLVGSVWLLSLTHTIVVPVIVAAIVASVASPLVDRLERGRVPRAAGAALVFLAILAAGVAVTVIVLAGITSEGEGIRTQLQGAADTVAGWLHDLGVDPGTAHDAKEEASASVTGGFNALLEGVVGGIERLASLAVFLSFTALSLFLMLKDAPTIGAFVRRHLGVPPAVAETVTRRTTGSLRGYFAGVTIVAAFSAVIVGVGALALGVPLPGTIAVVTFIGGYVPYLGAWAAGAFAVMIALGGAGPEEAAALAVIVLLANGALQQMVQPIAYGATLGIHPLAVLIVTIAGGSLFGTIGLVLAAPLTAAAVQISGDLAAARAQEEVAETEATGAGAGRSPPDVASTVT